MKIKKTYIIIVTVLLLFITGCSRQSKENAQIFDDTNKKIIPNEEKLSELEKEEKTTKWIGEFPINTVLFSNGILEDNYGSFDFSGYKCEIFHNNKIDFYEETKMDLTYKIRGYINFNSEIDRNIFKSAKTMTCYYKITSQDTNSYIDYVIVLTYPNSKDECLTIRINKNENLTERDSFLSFETVFDNLINKTVTKYPIHPNMNYTQTNKNSYISEQEIINLILKQQELNLLIFNNEKTLPLDYITTTKEEFKKGFIRVDVENSECTNFEELKNKITSIWDEKTSQYLLYFQNGITYHYEKNEELGGLTTTEKLYNINPFYTEENGLLYSTAFNEYDENLLSEYYCPTSYFVEITKATETQCIFKKWFRNPNYGILNNYKYTKEFLYYEALLVKNSKNEWVFGYIFNSPDEYKEAGSMEQFYKDHLISLDLNSGFKNKF